MAERRGGRQQGEPGAGQVQHTGATSEVLVADLSDPGGLDRVRRRAAAGDVDVLVSNAGVSAYGDLVDIDGAELERAWMLDAIATLVLVRAALPAMLERGRGGVISVASALAFSAGLETLPAPGREPFRLPRRAPYASAKAAAVAFTRTLATELTGTGVTATVVCPGLVFSEWNDGAFRVPDAMTPADVARAAYGAHRRGEVMCLPAVDDLGAWRHLEQAEAELLTSSNRPGLAARYH